VIPAASFCGYFALLVYCDIARPLHPGYKAVSRDGAVVLTQIAPDSPAARAGMAVGDRLIAVNDLVIIDHDSWGAVAYVYEINDPMPVVIERNGRSQELTLLLPPQSPDFWFTQPGGTLLFMRLAQFLTLVAGLTVALRRPRHPAALAAAWFLLTCAVFVIALPNRLALVWRDLPVLIRELLWIPYASSIAIGPILLTFATLFPRRLPNAGSIQLIVWVLAGIALASPLNNAVDLVYDGGQLRTIGPNSYALVIVSSVSLAAAMFLSFVHYRRVQDRNERRRLRVVVAGIAVAVFPGFTALVYFWLSSATNQASSVFETRPMVLVGITLLAAPLSITYAVLRHRLFDLSFTIRKAVQYTLARLIVLSLVPAISVFMILETLRNRHETVNTVLERRGALFLSLTALAFVIFSYRRRWLKAIDRRFFRERHYAYAVLRDVAEQVRRAGSLHRVAPLVVARIESVMHPEFAALLVRDPETRSFRTVAAAPSAAGPPDLREDSKLVALARIIEEPLDTSSDGDQSLLHQIGPADGVYLNSARIDVLIRVVTPEDELCAFLALGPKRSEEPYADEDFGVLVTIAENLGLLAARSTPRREQATALEECPECGDCFDAGTGTCRTHHCALMVTALPRALADRYRLDKRLASGGMGIVYKAFDLALERDIAAKVVAEKMTSDPGAMARFVEEAKNAARLRDHPNVVTVYDFGVIDERQAYLIMELLEGRTLRQQLVAEGKIEPQQALGILEDVASAIATAHRWRLVHRDLKPENIFLVNAGHRTVAKVLDFGIAKPLSVATSIDRRLTNARMLLGTLEYMSPEQRRGDAPTKAWDVWSLAVVALEMLSGTPSEPMAAFDIGQWLPGNSLRDTMPECVEVFNRALAIDPATRPPDVESLVREIAAALQSERSGGHGEKGGRRYGGVHMR